jgi:hypothetical protein
MNRVLLVLALLLGSSGAALAEQREAPIPLQYELGHTFPLGLRVSIAPGVLVRREAKTVGFTGYVKLEALRGLVVVKTEVSSIPLDGRSDRWWVDVDVATMTGAFRTAMATPREQLEQMGDRGRAWMSRSFGWNEVGRRMADTYNWILTGSSRPSCVVVD